MDGMVIGLYLLATFIGGLVSGLAGFALGLVVSGIWLHIITPLQAAILMAGYGIFTQGYGIWKLRQALSWRKAAPFIVGSALGVPVGTTLLTVINPAHLRTVVGLLLVIYSVYGLAKPVIKPMQSGTPVNVGVGFLNGLLGGLTGLAGVVVAVWCQLQGWPKDMQRTIIQPALFAALTMSTVALIVAVTLLVTLLYSPTVAEVGTCRVTSIVHDAPAARLPPLNVKDVVPLRVPPHTAAGRPVAVRSVSTVVKSSVNAMAVAAKALVLLTVNRSVTVPPGTAGSFVNDLVSESPATSRSSLAALPVTV